MTRPIYYRAELTRADLTQADLTQGRVDPHSLWWGATREAVLWVGLLWDLIGGPPTGGSAHDSGHTQRVVLDGRALGPVSVLSGVPRGLDWGPILFLVFVGDLPRVIGSSVHRQLCPVWEHVFYSGLFGTAGEPCWLGTVGG